MPSKQPMTEAELDALLAAEAAGGVSVGPSDLPFTVGESRVEGLKRTSGVNVVEGGVNAPAVRALAARPIRDRIEEKMLTIMTQLGLSEDDVIAVPDPERPLSDPNDPSSGGETILVRLPGSKDFVEFDPPDFERMADTLEVLAPLTSGEVMGGVLGAGALALGGAGLTARLLGSAAGAGVGLLTESEIERMFGVEQTPRGEVAGQALGAAGMAAAGEAAGEVLHGAAAVMSGGLRGTPPALSRLVRQTRMRAVSMPAGASLIGPSPADIPPFLRAIQGLASRMHLPAQKREIDKFYGYLQMLEQRSRALTPQVPTARLQEVADQWARELESRAQGPLKTTYLRAGKAVAQGAQAFYELRKNLHDKLFNEVRRLAFDQGVEFNIQRNRAAMDALLRGELGQSATDPTGLQVIMQTSPLLSREIMKFYDLPDNVSGAIATTPEGKQVVLSAYDALKDIRTNLYNLGRMSDPRQERIRALAIDAISQTMQNPVGGNAEFKAALHKAETAFKTTQRVMDISLMRERVKMLAKRPERVGRLLINSQEPLQARSIRAMFAASEAAGTLPAEAWEQVKKGYYTRLLDTPNSIPQEIARWRASEGGGRYLLTQQDEQSLRGYYRFWKAHQSGPVGKFVEETSVLANAEFQQLLNLPPRELQDLITRSGGKQGSLGVGLRAALWRRLLDGARTKRGALNVEVLDRGTYLQHFERIKEEGLADLVFTQGEMDDAQLAFDLTALAPGGGMGEGLVTAEKASAIAGSLHAPRRGAMAYVGAKTTALIAFLFTNAAARRMMRETVSGQDISRLRRVGIARPLGIAAAMVMDGIERNAAAYYGSEAEPSGPSIEVRPEELLQTFGIHVNPGQEAAPPQEVPELKPFQP